MVRTIRHSLEAALVLGCLSAFGDWVWAHVLTDGSVPAGIAHGGVVFLVLALLVARGGGRRSAPRSVLLLLPSGLVIAALFYPLATLAGYVAGLVSSWSLMWLVLAAVRVRLVGASHFWVEALVRGALAALLSGLSFWSVAWLWTAEGEGTSTPARAALWAYAFLPGFLALFVGGRGTRPGRESTSAPPRDTLPPPSRPAENP